MRILHVINSVGLSGGAEQQLESNIRMFGELTGAGEHFVAYLYEHGEMSRAPNMAQVATMIHVHRGHRGSKPVWSNVLELRRVVNDVGPDLIHCTLADASLACRIVGRLTGVPVLESLVNISHEPVRMIDNPAVKPWKLAIHRLVDRLTMRWVSHFHALTDTVKDSWVKTVGIDPVRVTVIPRGIDFSVVDESRLDREQELSLRESLGIQEGQAMLLMVGRQEAQKGHRIALQAMAELKRIAPEARLVLAGRQGNRSSAIAQMISELDLDDVVIQLGPRKDVHALMEVADVFVFPSLFEGMGVSLIEAMAHGLPVVVLDRPPMNRIVGADTGYVADAEGRNLAETIASVLLDPDRALVVGSKAREEVYAKYQLATAAARTLELYRSLIRS
jgi:glycosyltransferase involved in cell wall biosynthesis